MDKMDRILPQKRNEQVAGTKETTTIEAGETLSYASRV